ncbi:MAG: hypothetical protein FWH06_04680 [Oscillospiraceae bacterium]|nr:hypothetical protein [Oscillospiraceae bacterium]
MATLVKCSLCGRDVSSEAKACPGCGHDVAGDYITTVSHPHDGQDLRFEVAKQQLEKLNAEGWELIGLKKTGTEFEVTYTFKKTNLHYLHEIEVLPPSSFSHYKTAKEGIDKLIGEGWTLVGVVCSCGFTTHGFKIKK